MLFYMRFLFVLIVLMFTACSARVEPPAGDSAQPGSISPRSSQVSTLNAGEIDDNAQWEQYLQYRSNFLQLNRALVQDVDISERQIISVTDQQGQPVPGARVLVYGTQQLITESRTYADGQTAFFPKAWADAPNEQHYRVVVQSGNTAVEFLLEPQRGTLWDVKLDNTGQQDRVPLDVLFLLDATGSMGDEIAQLQQNILNISAQINQLPGNVDVQYGLVIYRDRGDEYVTRAYDFVGNVQDFQTRLNAVRAGGGGDIPESLNEALHVAIQEVSWRGDQAVKLVFLVADAPPHLDYANDYRYSHEMVAAAWQGIKIFPIASSGLALDGEFIFRQIAQYTMGRFIFLTYQQGTSGEAGSERTDLAAGNQGDYTVEQLDELVMRSIKDELAALHTPVNLSGIAPQLRSATLQATNPIPASFALVQQQPSTVYDVPRSVPVRTAPSDSFQVTISLPLLVTIAAVCMMAYFLLGSQRRVEKRKRKNEEIIVEAED